MFYSLLRRLWPKPIANNGSQLRDHQANERTFLSWNRMGLAFAAMSLALGRLDIIDNVFNRKCNDEINAAPKPSSQTASVAKSLNSTILRTELPEILWNRNDLMASRICQVISIWSFGYSLARYVSVRRHLLLGHYVPAIWGPLLVTSGSLGVFGITLKLE